MSFYLGMCTFDINPISIDVHTTIIELGDASELDDVPVSRFQLISKYQIICVLSSSLKYIYGSKLYLGQRFVFETAKV